MSFDFDAAVLAPFRMQPGLRKLADGARQLTPAAPGGRHAAEKLKVFTERPQRALAKRAGFDPSPALQVLYAQAAAEHPGAWQDGPAALAPALGWSVAADGGLIAQANADPAVGAALQAMPATWRRPALLALAFEEDIAVVDGADASVPWMAVALPSHWAPERKAGVHFAQLHAAVADNELLVAAGQHLMRMVCAPQRWERFVWNATPHGALSAHPDTLPERTWAEIDDLGAAWWRTERQSFVPVPAARQAAFLINVQVQPLGEALADPQRAQRVHDAVATMSPAVLAYRGLATVRERLLAWLHRRASAA
jgi:hypothetical protein